MATQPQRKPSTEASPPPRRTAMPPPANDNRARKRPLLFAAGAIALTATVALAWHLLA